MEVALHPPAAEKQQRFSEPYRLSHRYPGRVLVQVTEPLLESTFLEVARTHESMESNHCGCRVLSPKQRNR